MAEAAQGHCHEIARVRGAAPEFAAKAVVNGEIKEIKLSEYRGKHVILFFYPLDFTFVCPTEIVAFSDRIAEFERRGTQVIGVSVDSQFTHLAWIKTPRNEGGLGGLKYPLVSDIKKEISRSYGVLIPDGISLRGLFIIDREGIIRSAVVNDLPLGRSVNETLRVLDALQYTEKHGEVCPVEWTPGMPGMKATTEGVGDYFRRTGKVGAKP